MTKNTDIQELQLENQRLREKLCFYEDIFQAITTALSPLLEKTDKTEKNVLSAFATKEASFSEKNLGKAMTNAEKAFLQKILYENHWNICRSAKIMGIPRESLYYRIKKYGLVRDESE